MRTDVHSLTQRYGYPDIMPTRVACAYYGGSRTTLQRFGPAPVGKRGMTFYYAKADLDAWILGGLATSKAPQNSNVPAPTKRAVSSGNASQRLAALRRRGGQ